GAAPTSATRPRRRRSRPSGRRSKCVSRCATEIRNSAKYTILLRLFPCEFHLISAKSVIVTKSGGCQMSWRKHEYDSIPGTYVFDGKTAHSAYGLNKLLFSFNHEPNRLEFARDKAAYADKFGLTA